MFQNPRDPQGEGSQSLITPKSMAVGSALGGAAAMSLKPRRFAGALKVTAPLGLGVGIASHFRNIKKNKEQNNVPIG